MSTTPFEIKVVYDATHRRRKGAVVRTAKSTGRAAGGLLAVGALLNFAVATGIYYATWWKADPHIYMVFMTKMPLDVSREFAYNPLGLNAATLEALEQDTEENDSSTVVPAAGPRWTGRTAQFIIPITAYAWLTLATVSACAVALAGGAWLGFAGGSPVRLLGLVGSAAVTLFLGYAAFRVWSESQRMFDPDKLRMGMGLLVLLFALFGVPLASRARGITRLAAVSVLIAALATGAAVWLGAHSGALDFEYAQWPTIATAFAIHGVWGIVLLAALRRMEI